MNDTFLLAGDTFMPKMYLKQTGFIYRACAPIAKKEYKDLQKEDIKIHLSEGTRKSMFLT